MAGTRLTDAKLRNIAAGSNLLTSASVKGLVFKPSTASKGVGAWILRYTDPTTKKRTKITLGHYPLMSILEAENEAKKLQAAVPQGLDPKLVKHKDQDERLRSQNNTFFKISEQFYEQAKHTNRWKNAKTISNWGNQMQKYVYPVIGMMPITSIAARDIAAAFADVWNRAPEVGSRTFFHVQQVFIWAEAMGYCTHNPCAAAKFILGKQILAPASERRMPSLAWQDVPKFINTIYSNTPFSVSRAALLFLILNACRPGALRFLLWDDVDMGKLIWTLMPERQGSKTLIPRFYPTSTQCADLLRSLSRDNALVFPSQTGKPLSDAALVMLLRKRAHMFKSDMAGRVITPHGFRATFKGWSVSHGYEDRLSELQLCHEWGNKVQRAYDRQHLTEERRLMMQAWADYCFSEVESVWFSSSQP